LPTFAEKQLRIAQQYPDQLLNRYGAPNTSSFCTFAYCATSHIDDDEGITSGIVVERSESVKRNESNFVWQSHKLLVELQEGAYWFWDAPVHYHGTTMNHLALTHPQSYKLLASDRSHDGQWTLVNTFPKAVVDAARAEVRDEMR